MKEMKEIKTQGRQGDVFLLKVSKIPSDAKLKEQDRVVAAYGEATGHHHVFANYGAVINNQVLESGILDAPVDEFVNEQGQRFVSVKKEAALVHCKKTSPGVFALTIDHRPAEKILPGDYMIIEQRQHSITGWRKVVD